MRAVFLCLSCVFAVTVLVHGSSDSDSFAHTWDAKADGLSADPSVTESASPSETSSVSATSTASPSSSPSPSPSASASTLPPASASTQPTPSQPDHTTNDNCPYNKATDKCTFVKEDDDCHGTLIQYLEIYACNEELRPALVTIYIVWLLLLFYLLGTTADSFFCPCLEQTADMLHMGPRLAGVTLLSLGNGAPDVFSAIAAVRDGEMGLVLGDFSGAGMFVCSVVAGGVIFISGGLESRLWHIKDVLLYLLIVIVLILMLRFNWLTHGAAGLLLGYYVLYVFMVFMSERGIKRNHPRSLVEAINPNDVDLTPNTSLLVDSVRPRTMSAMTAQSAVDEVALSPNAPLSAVVIHLLKEVLRWLEKPFLWLRYMTIPVATPKDWDRRMVTMATVFSLVLVAFWQEALTKDLGGGFPLYGLLLILGAAGAVVVFFTSTVTRPPPYAITVVLLILGFINSAVWISLLATELVEVLSALGRILNISQLFLGATVLAWGNSVGDLTADLVMAKNKRQSTAITACYAGPLFNILMGLGIGVSFRARRLHTSLSSDTLTAFVFLCVTLAITAASAYFVSPVVPRYFSYGLWGLYAAFMVTVLVQEFA